MIQVRKTDDVKATGAADVEAWTIGDVYQNREMVLAHPEQFGRIVTKFVAGGLGALGQRDVTIAELARCWQHDEFRYKCPDCGHETVIYFFAGRVNSGGYWEIRVYCPECDCGYSIRDPQGLRNWTVMRDILKAESTKNQTH